MSSGKSKIYKRFRSYELPSGTIVHIPRERREKKRRLNETRASLGPSTGSNDSDVNISKTVKITRTTRTVKTNVPIQVPLLEDARPTIHSWSQMPPIIHGILGFLGWNKRLHDETLMTSRKESKTWSPVRYWPWAVCKQWYSIAQQYGFTHGLFCELYYIWKDKPLSVSKEQLIKHTNIIATYNHYMHTMMHECDWTRRAYMFRLSDSCSGHFEAKARNVDCNKAPFNHDRQLVAIYPTRCPICQLKRARAIQIAKAPTSRKDNKTPLRHYMNRFPLSVRVFMIGPPDTAYAGGLFISKMILPSAWPFKPPKFTMQTPIFHVNIDPDRQESNVQISTLSDWSPVSQTMRQITLSVLSLLSDPDTECTKWPNEQVKRDKKLWLVKTSETLDGKDEAKEPDATDSTNSTLEKTPIDAKQQYMMDKVGYAIEASSWTSNLAVWDQQQALLEPCTCRKAEARMSLEMGL